MRAHCPLSSCPGKGVRQKRHGRFPKKAAVSEQEESCLTDASSEPEPKRLEHGLG